MLVYSIAEFHCQVVELMGVLQSLIPLALGEVENAHLEKTRTRMSELETQHKTKLNELAALKVRK